MGFVYVLTNPHMRAIKIGFTDRHVEARVEELSSASGVPAPFEIAYAVEVPNADGVEAEVHRLLAAFRLTAGREFFSCSLEDAIGTIEGVTGSSRSSQISRPGWSDSRRRFALGAPANYPVERLRHRCPECDSDFYVEFSRRRDMYLYCAVCHSPLLNPRWDSA